MALDPRIREISRLVPGQSRLRGRSRRHPSLATDAQAWARVVWTPCLPQPRSRHLENGFLLGGWDRFSAVEKGDPGDRAQRSDRREAHREEPERDLVTNDRDEDERQEGEVADP